MASNHLSALTMDQVPARSHMGNLPARTHPRCRHTGHLPARTHITDHIPAPREAGFDGLRRDGG